MDSAPVPSEMDKIVNFKFSRRKVVVLRGKQSGFCGWRRVIYRPSVGRKS